MDENGNSVEGSSGILQMQSSTPGSQIKEWRYVCDDYFDSSTNGPNVACKELGHLEGTQQDATVQGDWLYWDNVQCNGLENSIADCERPFPGICAPSEAVKLNCVAGIDIVDNKL